MIPLQRSFAALALVALAACSRQQPSPPAAAAAVKPAPAHATAASASAPAASAANAVTPAAPADPHGGVRAPQTAAVTRPMPAPAGGMTIASLWSGRKSLAGKPVTVHGVVVKYNPGILGVNWIHLQDGTGKAADGSNDVTVTTTDDVPVKVGDTLVATGTVATDKNIGQGYAYGVLVERAKVSPVKSAGM